MNTIQYTVISIILCFNKAYDATLLQNATTITTCPKLFLTRTTMNSHLSNYKSNSRILKAKVKPLTQNLSTFPLESWNKINFSSNSSMDDLATTLQCHEDNIEYSNEVIETLYNSTLYLLLLKMQTWLNSGEGLDTIDSYLGYDEETRDLINISMTELFSHQRNDKSKHMDRLASLFYYSCDIKNMYENQDVGRDEVEKTFQSYMDTFGFTESKRGLIPNENTLIGNLKMALFSIAYEKNICYANMFGVTVASMKMRILTMPSDDEIINSIKRRPTNIFQMHTTVQKLVESYAREINANIINKYHVSILGVIIQDLFGYAYNHFELLTKLEEYDIDESDLNLIIEFSIFMSGLMVILVDRFFEFKSKLNLELVNAMYDIIYFLNPTDPQLIFGKDFSVDELSILRDVDFNYVFNEKKSIFNYYQKSERDDIVNNYMPKIMNSAIDKLLITFSGEDPEYWYNNRSTKIHYQQNHFDKQELLELIQQNNINALSILNTFLCEFAIKYDLYDKYQMNNVEI